MYMQSCFSCVQLSETPWTVACQAPPSMGFSRQEYWSGLPYPPPRDLPDPGIEPLSPALAADSSPLCPLRSPSPLFIITQSHQLSTALILTSAGGLAAGASCLWSHCSLALAPPSNPATRHPAHIQHLLCLVGAALLCVSGPLDRRSRCAPASPQKPGWGSFHFLVPRA